MTVYTEIEGSAVIEHNGLGEAQRGSVDDLDPARREVLLDWIAQRFNPAQKVSDKWTSDILLKGFRQQTKVDVNHADFKSAMLVAGYRPYNEQKMTWRFRIKDDLDPYRKPVKLLAKIPFTDVWEIDNLLVEETREGYNVQHTKIDYESRNFTPQEAVHWYKVVCKYVKTTCVSIWVNDSRTRCTYRFECEDGGYMERELPADIVMEVWEQYDKDVSERERDKS